MALVGAANAVDHEFVLRDVIKARDRAAIVQGNILFFGEVDRVLHGIAEADLLSGFAPAVAVAVRVAAGVAEGVGLKAITVLG